MDDWKYCSSIVSCVFIFFFNILTYSQNVAIGDNIQFDPHNSALLELRSDARGFLTPRLTTEQRDAIPSPADGLIIFNTDVGCIEYFFVNQWFTTCGFPTQPCLNFALNVSTSVDAICLSGSNGYATVIIESGYPPFVFEWNTGEHTQTISNLSAGNYSVTVTDVYGCSGTIQFDLYDGTLLPPSQAPVAGVHNPGDNQIDWFWSAVVGANGYLVNTTNDATTAIDNNTNLSYVLTQLNQCTSYTFYVWAYNECGTSPVVELNATTSGIIPSQPIEGVHSSDDATINWSWHAVENASTYFVNTENNFSTSTDIGNDTSYIVDQLQCNTAYDLYVWAANNCGVSQPSVLTFTTDTCASVCNPIQCPDDPIVMDIQGNVYQTVLIGNQCWMAHNLRVKKFLNNLDITYAETNAQWSAAGTDGRWCYPLNNPGLENDYGVFYSGRVAVSGNICPFGWRVPTQSDWETLIAAIGTNQAANLKDALPFWNGNNACGFAGRQGGYRAGSGVFYDNQHGFWWAQTIGTSGSSWVVDFRLYHYDSYQINPWGSEIKAGKYIRCIKD